MIKMAKRVFLMTIESDLPEYDPGGIRNLIGNQTLDLGEGWSPEHTLPDHILEAAKRAVDKHMHYIPFGLPELRQAIAEKLETENGIEVDPMTEVLITTGGIEAEHLAIWTLVDPGDEVMMADPEYRHSYEPNVVMAGGKMVYVTVEEERRFKLNSQDVEKKITRKTKMIIIITPSNPTGAILDRDDLNGIADIAKKNDLIVLSDEVFEKFVYDGKKNLSIGSLPGMENRTLTLNSFSKSWNMAGFRIGYIAGPKELINRMANLQIHVTTSVSEIAQAAALAALKGPRDWLETAVKEYETRRNMLVEELNHIEGIHCLKPEGGRCVFSNIEKYGMLSLEFAKYLLKEANVFVIPTLTHQYGENAERYVKIGFCRPKKTITRSMKRIKVALDKLQF